MNQELSEAFKEALNKQMEMINNKDYSELPAIKKKFHQILNVEPTQLQVLANLACCEMIEGNNGLAINMIEKVLERIPDYDGAWSNLAIAYRAEGFKKQALQAIKKAVSLNRTARNLENLGTMYVNEGSPELGVPYLEEALTIEPNESACWNLGLLMLEMCDYYRGFHLYEAGLIAKERYNKIYPDKNGNNIPFWRGEVENSRRPLVIVYGEQGIGDELMYATAMPEMLNVCDVIMDCHPRLIEIFKLATWSKKVKAFYPDRKHDYTHHDWQNDYPIDYKLPIGSLFRWFRIDGKFPNASYLQNILPGKPLLTGLPRPYVGIGWSGGTKITHETYRSVELTDIFEAIKDHPGTFVSLQYQKDRVKSEIAEARTKGLVPSNFIELDAPYEKDYLRTAELIAEMDYCILPNTSATHLCGVMGKKCYTYTPIQKAWRYCSKSEYMAMYPETVRIVQQEPGQTLADTMKNAIAFGHMGYFGK